jgi:Reeler domain
MKSNLLLITLLLAGLFVVTTSSMFNPQNPPVGNTAGPGENTCARSGCHTGGTFTGTVKVTGLPDTVTPGTVYPITLTQTSNATRGGFQMTSMNSANTAAGTFATATGVSVGMGNSRQYARQSTPKTLAAGKAEWTFNWTAPATLTNPQIRFYFTTLMCNGNGNESSDNVVSGADTVLLRTTSASNDLPSEPWCQIAHQNQQLRITLINTGKAALLVHSMNGSVQMQEQIGADQAISTAHLASGIYVAQVTAGGKTETMKFFVGN